MRKTNRCPMCCGLGRILAFGVGMQPVVMGCPECGGLDLTPASADERPPSSVAVEDVDQIAEAAEVGAVEDDRQAM